MIVNSGDAPEVIDHNLAMIGSYAERALIVASNLVERIGQERIAIAAAALADSATRGEQEQRP